MVMTASIMRPLGTPAPDFELPDTRGNFVSLDDFDGDEALLVAFLCNHCPFVKHILPHFARFAQEMQSHGLAVVAINSNDIASVPDDAPAHMAEVARRERFTFPYLFDETQSVAKAYGAACTPDFFLFNADRELVYRGQYDGSRPGNDIPVTGKDLRAAIEALLAGRPIPSPQKCSIGCNIKWKPGNEPDYFNPQGVSG